jgi:hypothetical protein
MINGYIALKRDRLLYFMRLLRIFGVENFAVVRFALKVYCGLYLLKGWFAVNCMIIKRRLDRLVYVHGLLEWVGLFWVEAVRIVLKMWRNLAIWAYILS